MQLGRGEIRHADQARNERAIRLELEAVGIDQGDSSIAGDENTGMIEVSNHTGRGMHLTDRSGDIGSRWIRSL